MKAVLLVWAALIAVGCSENNRAKPSKPHIEYGMLSTGQYDAIKNRIREELKTETPTGVPMHMLSVVCMNAKGETTQDEKFRMSDSLTFNDNDHICTLKKVSLKYE